MSSERHVELRDPAAQKKYRFGLGTCASFRGRGNIAAAMREYSRWAKYYDAVYGFKNYEAEAERLHVLISTHKKSAGNTLLDVACGTGTHMSFLARHYSVEGLDIADAMLEVARSRHPEITFHQGDMLTFELADRKFDVVTCLFSAIGYVKTARRMREAILNMSRHLAPGGVLLVEPWLTRETWTPGNVHGLFVDKPQLKIARMDIPSTRGNLSVVKFHWLIGTPDGIEYFSERHELGLFSEREYRDAFSAARLEVSLDPKGLMGRGLYIATMPMP